LWAFSISSDCTSLAFFIMVDLLFRLSGWRPVFGVMPRRGIFDGNNITRCGKSVKGFLPPCGKKPLNDNYKIT
jgi:hypothetical protein